jgi:chaperonin cofactor prefoldin
MITKTELQQVVNQINKILDKLDKRITALEEKPKSVKKTTTKVAEEA